MRFLSDAKYRKVKSPSKYQGLDDLVEIAGNYYRSASGQEYVRLEVDALIAAKSDRPIAEPDWARVYSDACESHGEALECDSSTEPRLEPSIAGKKPQKLASVPISIPARVSKLPVRVDYWEALARDIARDVRDRWK